eukprot:9925331-Alexandrium_andersonii.AAC.1
MSNVTYFVSDELNTDISVHVDDFDVAGDDDHAPPFLEELGKKVLLKVEGPFEMGDSDVHVGGITK